MHRWTIQQNSDESPIRLRGRSEKLAGLQQQPLLLVTRGGFPMYTSVPHLGRVFVQWSTATLALLCTTATAQSLNDVRPPSEPLVLKAQGSFFVGGRQIFSDAAGWDLIGLLGQFSSGDVTVDQMYVQFQIPEH